MAKKGTLPLVAVDGHLVGRTWDDVWAVFALKTHSYRAEPRRRQRVLAQALEHYAQNAQADFQILRVSRRFNAAEYAANLRENMPAGAHRRLYNLYIQRQRNQLEGLQAWRPLTFLAVRLADPRSDITGHAARAFVTRRSDFWRAIRRQPLATGDLLDRGRVAEARLTDHLEARPATRAEICWLISRAFCRGLAEPDLAVTDWAEPQRIDRLFADVGLQRCDRHVICNSEQGNSYQSTLALREMGHAQAFTRQAELMFTSLEEHPWPVDAALNVSWWPNDRALRKVTRQIARTDNALKDEEASMHGARDEGRRRFQLSDELHSRLTATGEPVLYGTLSLVVPAQDLDELETRVRAVKERFPWPIHRPYGDQLAGWTSHLPGQPHQLKDFDRPFMCDQVGAMVPHATHTAGSTSKRAFYIAKSLHGSQPVLFDLSEGTASEKSPTIALIASQGGGKTTLLQLLLYQAFLQGARVVDCDPKGGGRGEHRFHQLPEVREHAQEIALGPEDRFAGALDPLRVAPLAERHEAAATFLTDILPGTVADNVEPAINGAIVEVLDADPERACCTEVINTLRSSRTREWQRIGTMLAPYSRSGLARLGFATADMPLPREAQAQVTYLNIRALKRAAIETVHSEMSLGQRWGRAVMQLVALYAMRILGQEPYRLKVLGFDETAFLAQDAVGAQMLDLLSRWGRSEYAVPIVSDQLLATVGMQENLIGHWFFFAMQSRDEAQRALRAHELDDDGPLVDALTGRYEKGKGLYLDLSGNSDEIQVDLGNWGLLEALSPEGVDQKPIESIEEEATDVFVPTH